MKRCKLNKEDFMSTLYKNNKDFREGLFTIIEGYKRGSTNMTVKNRYGILKVMPDSLLEAKKLTVNQAIDKGAYTMEEIKEYNPELYPFIKSIKVEEGSDYYVETVYGLIRSDHTRLMRMKKIPLKSAINPADFWLRRNRDIRKDFENIDYSNAKWISNEDKVKLRCKIHDYHYEQRPSHHTAGIQGCPHCMTQTIMYTETNFRSHEEFFKDHKSFLYIIKLKSNTEEFYKVGITAENRLQYRMNDLNKYYDIEISYNEKGLTTEMYRLEQRFLKEFEKYRYTPKQHFTGHTECLTVNPLDFYYHYYNN